MIWTIVDIALRRLWNNKQELVLTFVVPVLFFSIFALILGRGVGGGTAAIKVAVIDDDNSQMTNSITQLIKEQDAFELKLETLQTNADWPLERLTRAIVRDHGVDVVIYLPPGSARRD